MNRDWKIDITETKPNIAICIIDADVEVDFERPRDMPDDYEEKVKQDAMRSKTLKLGHTEAVIINTDKKFKGFTGTVHRIDGKAFDQKDKELLNDLHDNVQKVDS